MSEAAGWKTLLRVRWEALAAREKTLVIAAGALVVLALAWWVLLAPALQTLRDAERLHPQLDAQLQRMRGLQAEAQTLQSQPKLAYDDALRALESSVRQRLGSGAQINVVGDRATVVVKGVTPDALAQWLAQARINARALPAEARLVRTAAGVAGASSTTWDGTLVLVLPAR